MAYGEQWKSRRADSSSGTRIFLVPWGHQFDEAGPYSIPKFGEQWSQTYDPTIDPSQDQDLWVENIEYEPYGKSSANWFDAATECRVVVHYVNHETDLTSPSHWVPTPTSQVQAVEIGPHRVFATSRQNIGTRGAVLVMVTEVVWRGEQNVTDWTVNALALFDRNTYSGTVSDRRLGFGGLIPNVVPKAAPWSVLEQNQGHLMFLGDKYSEPFFRRVGQARRKIRTVERSFLLRLIRDDDNFLVGGHNHVWDSANARWDLTDPLLYPASTEPTALWPGALLL